MDKKKNELKLPESIACLTDAEFLQFLYSEREREESLNSYQGWNVWAVVGALITVVCTAYGVISAYADEINRVRTLYFVSSYLSNIFMLWYVILFYLSYLNRKRAKDYKRIKHLKDIAPIPYLVVATVCSLAMALEFVVVNVVHDIDWNLVSISWGVLAAFHVLICTNVYLNRNAFVWAVKEDIWFARTWVMVVAGLLVLVFFWLIWKWSYQHITGPYIGTPEFELAICFTAIIMLVYLFLKIKLSNRKSSEIDVLIDEYVYKGQSKESVFKQLRANQMGYGILESCTQELYALQSYSEILKSQKERLKAVKATLTQGSVDVDSLLEQLGTLKHAMDANDEWACRVDALHDKVNEIDKNVPELKNEDEFLDMLKIVGHMMGKGREMNDKIRTMIEEMEKFIEGIKKIND